MKYICNLCRARIFKGLGEDQSPACRVWSNSLLKKTKVDMKPFGTATLVYFAAGSVFFVRCKFVAPPFIPAHEVLVHTLPSSHAYDRAVAALNSCIIPLSAPFKKVFENWCTKHILQKINLVESLGKRGFASPCCCRWNPVHTQGQLCLICTTLCTSIIYRGLVPRGFLIRVVRKQWNSKTWNWQLSSFVWLSKYKQRLLYLLSRL